LVSLFRRHTGHGRYSQSLPADTQARPADTQAIPKANDTTILAAESKARIPSPALPPDNPDPMKPSISLKEPIRGLQYQIRHIRNLAARYWRYMRPPLTPEQIEQKQLFKEAARFDRLMFREAKKYARLLSRKYGQIGFKHIEPTTHRVRLIRFDQAAWNNNGTVIQLHAVVDPTVLPDGVLLIDLADPKFTNELLPTIGHPCRVSCDREGVIVEIQRAGREGLPDFITVADQWQELPENKPPLTFPVGIAENGRKVWIDLDDCPHILIGGSTKQGKSNMINVIICSFIRRLTPTQVQFILFDLKQGMEFGFYDGLPHLYPGIFCQPSCPICRGSAWVDHKPCPDAQSIIENINDVLPALGHIEKIMYHRMDRIKKAGYKSANDYNLHHKGRNRLSQVVIVFDEWATIAKTTGIGTQAENILMRIANMARAAGIYIIIGTQNPRADVISTIIKVNFSVRIAFKTDMPGSMAILNNQKAIDLPCKGRAILDLFSDFIPVQTPRITDDLIRATVHKAITGKDIKAETHADIEEILQYALDKMDGRLNVARLFEVFRQKKIRYETLVRALKEAEGNEYILSGSKYKVKAAAPNKPRMLVIIE
jgi:hypothetical protein